MTVPYFKFLVTAVLFPLVFLIILTAWTLRLLPSQKILLISGEKYILVCGSNSHGQLGSASSQNEVIFVEIPFPFHMKIVQVAGGWDFSLAVTGMYSWSYEWMLPSYPFFQNTHKNLRSEVGSVIDVRPQAHQ